jgi:methylphosphotriester-DNA--protein-cysteine methyltransferase
VQGAPAIFQEHVLGPATVDGAVWRFSRPDQKPAHFHGQIEFLLIRRGHARERIGRGIHAVHAGHLLWHLPGIEHEFIEASSDLDLRVVHVEPDLVPELALFSNWSSGLGRLASGRPAVELTARDCDALLEDIDLTSNEAGWSADAKPRLRRALSNAYRATCAEYDGQRQDSWVELACCLLLEQPWLDRPGVCRALDVSEGYLSRRFTAELGLSFLEQRARLRIVRFLAHVTREGKTFLEAALCAGFGSYSQLHRVFVRIMGMSPRVYLDGNGRNRRGVITRESIEECAHRSQDAKTLRGGIA